MRCARPVIAADPNQFGQRRDLRAEARAALVSAEDIRLFLTTFVAGFVFVGVLIA